MQNELQTSFSFKKKEYKITDRKIWKGKLILTDKWWYTLQAE